MSEKSVLLLDKTKPIIAMIHVQALPGTPSFGGDSEAIIDAAIQEAELYSKVGVDILMIENMHDRPYLNKSIGPEITAMMTVIGKAIKQETGMPCGIQILAGANKEAIAVAKAADLDFVRAEGFVFGHLADEGFMESDAGSLLRYRKKIGAENIPVFTDIKKKHSAHAMTSDVSLVETAKAAAFFLSDGLIVTGSSTGKSADRNEVEAVKEATDLPVLVGSGITVENVAEYYSGSDGLIVGSYFKEEGKWFNPIDIDRVSKFMEKVVALRN